MKALVRMMTIAATVSVMTGGTMLESANIMLPLAVMTPGVLWFGLLAWVNRREE